MLKQAGKYWLKENWKWVMTSPIINREHNALLPSKRGYYSGFVSRTFAYLTDVIIIGLTISISYWVISELLFQLVRIDISACPPPTANLSAFSCNAFRLILNLYNIVFTPFYFLFFWLLAGQTPGKAILGIQVQRLDGGRMTLLNGIVRLFGYVVCFLSIGVGFFWVLLDDKRQGWHDKLARTCVVYKWEARQDDKLLERANSKFFR